MALVSVETGRFLKKLGIGVMLTDPPAPSLRNFFATLTPEKYHDFENAILSLPRANWVCTRSDCEELIKWLGSLRKTQNVFLLNKDPAVEIEQG
jgi:succinoglycan biosynthesis protein ExoL